MKELKILMIKYRPIGDTIMGLGTIQYIQKLFPGSKITYAVQERVLPLFSNIVCPDVEFKSISFLFADWFKTFNFIKKNNFDLIIELQQTGKSKNFFRLFSKFTLPEYYYHNHNHSGKKFILDQGIKKPVIQKDLDGVWTAFNYIFPNRKPEIPYYLDYEPKSEIRNYKLKNNNRVILGVSAGRKEKIWDLKNYEKLISSLTEINNELKFIIPLSEEEFDTGIEKEISNWEIKNYIIIKKSIGELPYEMSESNYYIGNDTGLKHLAVSLGMKTLTIFGEERPMEWHPYNLQRHSYVFSGDIKKVSFKEVLDKSIKLIKNL
ncbi:MAG: glycosyltransferase family 9 protein [bacterium]